MTDPTSPTPSDDLRVDGEPHVWYVGADGRRICLDLIDPAHLCLGLRDSTVLYTLLMFAADVVQRASAAAKNANPPTGKEN